MKKILLYTIVMLIFLLTYFTDLFEVWMVPFYTQAAFYIGTIKERQDGQDER